MIPLPRPILSCLPSLPPHHLLLLAFALLGVGLAGCDKKEKTSPQDSSGLQDEQAPQIGQPYARSAALDLPSFAQVEGCVPEKSRKKVEATSRGSGSTPLVIAAEAYLGLRPCIESISTKPGGDKEDMSLLIGTRDVFALIGDPVQGNGEVRVVPARDDGAIDSLEWIIESESSDEAFKGAFSSILNLYATCPEAKRRAAIHGQAVDWAEDQEERLQSTSDVMSLLMDGTTSDGFAVLCEDEARHINQLFVLEPVSSHNGEIALRRIIAYSIDAQDRVVDIYENQPNLRVVDPTSWKP